MRKFYVLYRSYIRCGEDEYNNAIITLDKNEKANIGTFQTKLNDLGGLYKEPISWSLIEE